MYRINPSLLNKWTELVNSDRDWEQFYGDADEPSVSPEEFFQKREQELLDAINRVPFKSEPASRGTALNELVDCIVENRKQREDMQVFRVYDPQAQEVFHQDLLQALRVELEGFTFIFDINLVRALADYYKGATCQYRCEATMDTLYGPVILYGDADYIRQDIVYDLKSTSRYSAYGKYSEGHQKDLYPWALTESGDVQGISGFEYTIVPLTGGSATSPIISGEIKTEYYAYDHDASTRRLRAVIEAFVPWIEEHRNLITYPRIFNEI